MNVGGERRGTGLRVWSEADQLSRIPSATSSSCSTTEEGGGFGVLPVLDDWQLGSQMTQPGLNVLDPHADLTKISDSLFVGVLLDLQDDGFADCGASWTGVSYAFEDWSVAFRDWAYTAIQRGGYGGESGNRELSPRPPETKVDELR